MTLHIAKGLEFTWVCIVGLEEGLLPHQHSLKKPALLEEERRLCYVGFTRARDHLLLACARRRRMYGKEFHPRPSRFLQELPRQLLQVAPALDDPLAASHPATSSLPQRPPWRLAAAYSTATLGVAWCYSARDRHRAPACKCALSATGVNG